MVENRPWADFFAHVILIIGVLVVAFPLYVTFVASTITYDEVVTVPMRLTPGDKLIENYSQVLTSGSEKGSHAAVLPMLINSFVMAMGVAIGKIVISIISAFAIVYFRFPLRNFFFWMIFVTLMLPIEVRIIPTFKVAADLPESQRTPLEELRTDTQTFTDYFEARRNRHEEWFKVPTGHVDVCNVPIPVRPRGAVPTR